MSLDENPPRKTLGTLVAYDLFTLSLNTVFVIGKVIQVKLSWSVEG